ncbi:MAG TPA: TraR/DksA C4-type zinc finger protein [Burkholderiales bacterium]|jgi:RNA polymerase-binding transcription factor DksA|nr:TraR/DksA C4-type zinc finger protein [Burkholderiales bacterium]HXJ10016.1 TraR/DksA C4-type zinc finger protein [Burkholderiales bacterium]
MALTREQSDELGAAIEQRRRVLANDLREDGAGAEVARELDELRGIEAAKQRFEEGSYGVCIDCGTDIGYARLRANPTALRCILCQTRYEKTFTPGTGGSSL